MSMVFSINNILPPFEEITLLKCSIASNCNWLKTYIIKRIKYLGLLLDCSLKCNIHINSLIVKYIVYIYFNRYIKILYYFNSYCEDSLSIFISMRQCTSKNVLSFLRVQRNNIICLAYNSGS